MTDLQTIKETLARNKCTYAYNEDNERVHGLYRDSDGNAKSVEYLDMNMQLNIRGDHIELVYYRDKPLRVPKHVAFDEELISDKFTFRELEETLSTRKFVLGDDGVAVPKYDSVIIEDMRKSLMRSSLRAKRNFYNYALSNNWEYFCTFTFAEEAVRLNKDLLYSEWRSFIKKLRRNNPELIALGVYERFENRSSGYHMHCLLGNCDLNLKCARNANGNQFLYTESNYQIFNCTDWKNGYNTVVPIVPSSHKLQVINYLSKYMNKNSPAPYGCKRYLHTNNLDCGSSYITFESPEEIDRIIKSLDLKQVYKSNPKYTREQFEKLSEDDKRLNGSGVLYFSN